MKRDRFRLSPDRATVIVMVGPGTGIALLRAFPQPDGATRIAGRTRLFSGNPHRATDTLFAGKIGSRLAEGTVARRALASS
ncbi:MAG: hypothetical protein RML45_06685 [Acetobacteraceae bacterium]|nr:hypothetical protein [Acetobacteraceae bacterium]